MRGFAGAEPPTPWPRLPGSPRPERLELGLETLDGVGPTVKKRLAALGLRTIGDAIAYRPRRYEPAAPELWETGRKDTVIAYPGQVTRLRLEFNTPGQYVWHCHIVEHEDNEMMRPYRVGAPQHQQPGSGGHS